MLILDLNQPPKVNHSSSAWFKCSAACIQSKRYRHMIIKMATSKAPTRSEENSPIEAALMELCKLIYDAESNLESREDARIAHLITSLTELTSASLDLQDEKIFGDTLDLSSDDHSSLSDLFEVSEDSVTSSTGCTQAIESFSLDDDEKASPAMEQEEVQLRPGRTSARRNLIFDFNAEDVKKSLAENNAFSPVASPMQSSPLANVPMKRAKTKNALMKSDKSQNQKMKRIRSDGDVPLSGRPGFFSPIFNPRPSLLSNSLISGEDEPSLYSSDFINAMINYAPILDCQTNQIVPLSRSLPNSSLFCNEKILCDFSRALDEPTIASNFIKSV